MESFFTSPNLLGQLQGDDPLGLRLHALPPELELGVDGAVEQEVLLQALCVKGTDRWVVAHLLRHPAEAQVLSTQTQGQTEGGGGGGVVH